MTPAQALAFVTEHGIVLEAGNGPVPSLSVAVAGGPIRGSWWGHARGREIFALTRALRAHPAVLVCRLVDGKVSYVHRRLWPALVRAAECFPCARLARMRELHLASGRHGLELVQYPGWVRPALAARAARLELTAALRELGDWHGQPPAGKTHPRQQARIRQGRAARRA